MGGFFTTKETQSYSRFNGKPLSCFSCGLYQKVNSPKMQPFGNFKKGIMNIGEAPSQEDDEQGKQWQGQYAKEIGKVLRKFDIDLYDDCINLNAVNCRPVRKGKNRHPSAFEINCCRRIVMDYVQHYKPKLIFVYGEYALQSVIGHKWKKTIGSITKWRGWTIPDQDLQCWICPMLHPSHLKDSEHNQGIEKTWINDFENGLKMLNEPFLKYKEPEIIELTDLSVLDEIPNLSTIAFDYETTGLKPDRKGHRIVTASVAVSEDKVYVFEMPPKAKDRKPFVDLLRNKYIKKIAQNMKFEHTWSRVILKTTVRNWVWDTMLATHILDNRPGITSLEFQTYVNFGVADYSSAVSSYLQAPTSNDFNKVREYIKTPRNKQELLKYNALDSIFEYRLAIKQMKIFEEISDGNK